MNFIELNLLDAFAGRIKVCEGPHAARGPYFAHPWAIYSNNNNHLCKSCFNFGQFFLRLMSSCNHI